MQCKECSNGITYTYFTLYVCVCVPEEEQGIQKKGGGWLIVDSFVHCWSPEL